jgi:hypothetical protein
MATLDPEVEAILAALGETPLAWLAMEGRAAVDALPDRPARTRAAEIEAVGEQLAAIERATLDPMRRELAATERLGPLAEQFGLSAKVELLLDDDAQGRRIVLNSEGRHAALASFVDVLSQSLGQARERVATRRGRGQ